MLKTGTGSGFFWRRVGLFVVTTLTFLASGIATEAQKVGAYRPVVGQPHADFSLPSITDGQAISLSDFAGKKVLLFHFASW